MLAKREEAGNDYGSHLTMSKLAKKLIEEFKALLPPTIFFFVALHIVALIRVLMLKGTGIATSTSLQVTLAALILGKAVLIADLLPFINHYPDKPLVYNVAWKTTIYVLVAMLVLLAVLILMYCTMHELVRVIGRDQVRHIFFGPPRRTTTLTNT
jgi:hypothetical protein